MLKEHFAVATNIRYSTINTNDENPQLIEIKMYLFHVGYHAGGVGNSNNEGPCFGKGGMLAILLKRAVVTVKERLEEDEGLRTCL